MVTSSSGLLKYLGYRDGFLWVECLMMSRIMPNDSQFSGVICWIVNLRQCFKLTFPGNNIEILFMSIPDTSCHPKSPFFPTLICVDLTIYQIGNFSGFSYH